MTIAAFLPPANADYVRRAVVTTDVVFATSWSDLESYASDPSIDLALVDPSAEGAMNIGAATHTLKHYRHTPVAAYVPLTCENLKAVVYLSGHGLREAFLHPMTDGRQLSQFAHRLAGHRLAYEFLGSFETRLAHLDPRLVNALRDLFERPHRYETAGDIGRESGVSTKSIYREFHGAGLGTPRKFVTAAKILRGYAYLRGSQERIGSIGKEVGYAGGRTFAREVLDIFGCSPVRLRKFENDAEVSTQLVEWVQKPERRGDAC
jgi:AraC-like DNA-binding protein